MSTYLTLPFPGDPGNPHRLLGVTSLGQAAFLSRACRDIDPTAGPLKAVGLQRAASPFLAGLVEIGEANRWVYVAEAASSGVALRTLLARGPLPPELACFITLRVCQACAGLPTPHLRISPRNVFLRSTGEPLVLGAHWARLLPAEAEDTPFVPEPPFTDARADAFGAAELARVLAGGESKWNAIPPDLRAALERAGAGPRRTWMLRPGELSALLERALGEQVLAGAPGRLAAMVPAQPAHPAPAANAPQLVISPYALAVVEESAAPGGPAIGLDGRIVDAARDAPRPVVPAQPVAAAPEGEPAFELQPLAQPLSSPVSAPAAPASGLELDEKALAHALGPQESSGYVRQAAAEFAAVKRRRIRMMIALPLIAVALCVGGFFAYPLVSPYLSTQLGSRAPAGVLRVDSDPSGATVKVGAEVLGETPYIGDNDLPKGQYALRVELPGYEPASVEIAGGASARVNVKLVPRKGGARKGP